MMTAEALKKERSELLGRRIRFLRESRGLSKSELGKMVGIDRTTIHDIETGERAPSVWVAASLAEALGTTVTRLLTSARKEKILVEEKK